MIHTVYDTFVKCPLILTDFCEFEGHLRLPSNEQHVIDIDNYLSTLSNWLVTASHDWPELPRLLWWTNICLHLHT